MRIVYRMSWLLAAAVTLVASWTARAALPSPVFDRAVSVSDLTLGGPTNHGLSIAFGVNAKGRVVGGSAPDPRDTSSDAEHAFVAIGDSLHDLGTLGGSFAEAHGVNRSGSVVGWSYAAGSEEFRGFLTTRHRTIDIGTLGGSSTFAMGINDDGVIVGASTLAGSFTTGAPTHAFARSDGEMTDLGTLGGTSSWAEAINSSGTIVGFSSTRGDESTHAFAFSDGYMFDLGTLGGASSSAFGVNDAGQIVGSAERGDGETHAFLLDGGQMRDLGTLGGAFSEARAINDLGDVVGSSLLADGVTRHAFMYTGGELVDLNSLLPDDSGWELLDAFAINRRGMVVGEGLHGGDLHAYLLALR